MAATLNKAETLQSQAAWVNRPLSMLADAIRKAQSAARPGAGGYFVGRLLARRNENIAVIRPLEHLTGPGHRGIPDAATPGGKDVAGNRVGFFRQHQIGVVPGLALKIIRAEMVRVRATTSSKPQDVGPIERNTLWRRKLRPRCKPEPFSGQPQFSDCTIPSALP